MREASGTSGNLTALPSGGGGIAPLGDRFQPDLVRGSGSYAVPIHLPKGPNELQPSLSLNYSTGSGNGPFGLGWRLDLLRIERRTDRGVPRYTDGDTFVLGDAEVLIPVGGNRYRTRTDNAFWFIERFGEGWRMRMGDGRTLFMGQTAASREADGTRVFSWHLDEMRDAAGNPVTYSYERDGNRLYLAQIQYSIFSLQVRYEPRPDVLRSHRAGFARVTSRRARALELHCGQLASTLMRTYALGYEQALNGASQLTRLSLSAEVDGQTAAFPELTFGYTSLDLQNWRVREIESDISPPGIEDRTAQIVDLTANALPDILQTSGGRMRVWHNRGDGRLEGPRELAAVPSTVALERDNVAFADLDGNGRVDLFAVNQPLELAFESNGKGGFKPQPIVFAHRPTMQLSSATARLMDVDGDGVTDLFQTGRSHFLTSRHQPGAGWAEPEAVRRIADLEQFPDVTFGDRGVRLADMSGDGLQDMVVIQSGNVCYWPALGHGAWAPRVEMELPPVFPRSYREDRLVVADVDGDGCADIVYFDTDRTLVWINQCGSAFAPPVELPIAPAGSARPRAVDFFGDGRVSFVWTAPGRHAVDSGWRCLRFDDGRKPNLMNRVRNGMGGVSEMEYSNSTRMRQLDEDVGRDWQHELPIVVHVVSSIRQRDTLTGRESLMSMRYHDGVYDGPERDFRGFVEASVESAGDDSVPATRQEVTFFQGEPEHDDLVERDRQRALAGTLLTTKTFELTAAGDQLRQESVQTWAVREEFVGPAGRVWFPHVTQIETREHSLDGAPARIERTQLMDFDEFGNPAQRLRGSLAEGEPPAQAIRSEERFTYTRNQTEWLIKLPVRAELRDAAGVPAAVQIRFYDGAPFVGLPEGQATHGLMTRSIDARLLDARLPADYIGGRDLTTLGFTRLDGGDTAGWYTPTMAVERDARGNPIEQRDPMGRPLRITYDADGVYPLRTRDARAKETLLVFNPRAGEPSMVTMPDGRLIRYEHDPIGRLVATFETDDAGNEQLVKCWLLDLASLPVSVTSIAPAGGGRTRAEFLPPADLTAAADVSVSRMFYDGFGTELLNVATGPDASDGTRRFVASKRAQLNAKGTAAVQFPPVYVSSLAFTPAPPVDAACVRQRYDAGGNVTETLGPGPVQFRVVRENFTIEHFEGGSAEAVRLERFDARGRLVRIEERPGGTAPPVKTSYDLTLDGRIEALRDDGGNEVSRYTFAGPGEAIRITHRDVGTRTYYRDAAGHLVERVDTDGSRLIYVHDALGRVTALEHTAAGSNNPQAIREIFYDEDPVEPSAGRFLEGRVALVREAGNETRLSYNRAGRTVREAITVAGETLVTQRIYDLQGRTIAIVYPDNRRVDYTLDRSGSVRGIEGVLDDVAYGADGAVEGYRLANGVEIAMPHDPVSRRLTQVAARRGPTSLRTIDYEYAPVGTIELMRDEMPGDTEQQRFTYDGLYRVTGYTVRRDNDAGALLRQGGYTNDAAGNLLTYEDTEALSLNYTSTAHPGRLIEVRQGAASMPVLYNSRGHIRAFQALTAIEYDPLDRVASMTKADGTTLQFAYDIESRRILKEVRQGGVTIGRVLYAAGLFERHAGRDIRHIYLGKRLVASESVTTAAPPVTTPAYYLSDHHGTVLLSIDADGNVVHQQRYSPYGAPLLSAAALDRYLGRARDSETGLIQLGVRYYAPALGRFISPDWYVIENPKKPARLPQGFNLYSYGLNNPLAFRDPSGMFIVAVLAAIAIVAAVASVAAFAVGFISGLVYGLSNGQGWGSLLTALEAGLTTVAGMWLGAIAGGAAGFLIGGPAGMIAGAVVGGLMGGMNGLISGVHGIYDWTSADGWFAFLSDSTWSLLGTTLGNVVHIINLFYSDSNYRHDLSHRQNRHVYEGGFALKQDFAFTQGNVISNAGQGGKGIDPSFIANHEELHIWQQRFFGPIFQATYVGWGVGGFIVASVYWLFNTDEDYGSLLETAAYYDNPFEYWAYKNDNYWPPSGVNSDLAWG